MTMPIEQAMARAAAATVRHRDSGLGVLVPGGYVLTAAQCIRDDALSYIIQGDCCPELFTAADGRALLLSPAAVELREDVAALQSLDSQSAYNEAGYNHAEAFEQWANSTAPVPVSRRTRQRGKDFAVHALRQDGVWRSGMAEVWDHGHGYSLLLVLEGLDEDSMGGPIIDDEGELVTVAPFGGDEDRTDWPRPYLRYALPGWLWEKITCAQLAGDHQAARAWLSAPTGAVAELLARDPDSAKLFRAILGGGDRADRAAFRDRCLEADVSPGLAEAVEQQMEHAGLWRLLV